MIPLDALEFWHWWSAAAVFVVIEVLAPGVVFLWLGVSAALVGTMLLLAPQMEWQLQFLIWGALSIASVLGWHAYRRGHAPAPTDEPTLNRRGHQYVGRRYTLPEPIVNGYGKLRIDDTMWKIEAEADAPAGEAVRVIAVDGTVLKVERIAGGESA